MTSKEQMLKVPRPMGILLNGIWQKGIGTYISLSNPYKVKIIINGKQIITDLPFLDFAGYNEDEINASIIQNNICSLPPAPIKKKTVRKGRYSGAGRWIVSGSDYFDSMLNVDVEPAIINPEGLG